ncbi:MAG: hypothetical protein GX758_04315, partial [Tenericutes bacterium]|nr:hypothetical protein [Mycoplasmatota bacterium]
HIYNEIIRNFELTNRLLKEDDLLNACAILRTTYENIIYVISTSYDNNIIVNLDSQPKDFRVILENNCDKIFTNYFEKEDFNEIYKYLCKIIHPSSMKELMSYLSKTVKYKKYMINNLKYCIVLMEYMYLNFLNKKVDIVSDFDLNLINTSTYVNLINITFYFIDVDKSQRLMKKYLMYDTNNKYVKDNNDKLIELYNELMPNKKMIEIKIIDMAKELDQQINNSKYKNIVDEILKN